MADIIGAIFGTSSTQTQKTVPDPIASALNLERYKQAIGLFDTQDGLYQFGGQNVDLAQPGSELWPLIDAAKTVLQPLDYSNIPTLGQYQASFAPVTDAYNAALTGLDTTTLAGMSEAERNYLRSIGILGQGTDRALARSYADYSTGLQTAEGTYNTATQDLSTRYAQAIARGDFDTARAIATIESNIGRNLGIQEFGRQRALDLGLDTTGGYIDQIATPRIMQQMTLAGLEQGGAVNDAVARAVAEVATPYLQSIEQLYGTNIANLLGQGTAQQGQVAASAAEGNRALGGQLLSGQTQISGNYQQNIAQLAQALMANNITLEQAGIAANSALGQQLIQAQTSLRQGQQQGLVGLAGTYIPQASAFAQSIPQAAQTLSMLPTQMQAGRAATMNALQPLLDYPRALREQDFLRRQGLFQTVYTGIPFSPGSTTAQKAGTGNIFDQLQGSFESGHFAN